MNTLITITLIVFLLNIPFGYWRANVRRFSAQWFLAIHLPVPFIVALRILSGIGFAWFTFVFLVGAFFLGQQFGSLFLKWLSNKCQAHSSCMVMDVYRCATS